MRYHWLSEQQNKKNFAIYWDKGTRNLADYHTKHHPPSYHKKVREKYILKGFLTNFAKAHTRVCSYSTTGTVCR